jgi:hypothetical protein
MLERFLPVMPILAEKAIKGARLKKDREIFVAHLSKFCGGKPGITASCSTRTHPIGNTICGERVIIAGEVSFIRPASHKSPFFFVASPAITYSIFRNLTLVHAERAKQTICCMRRLWRQAIDFFY